MKEPAVEGDLTFHVFGRVPSLPQLRQIDLLEIRYKFGLEYPVDASSAVVHSHRLLARSGHRWIRVDRRRTTAPGVDLEVEVGAATRGIPGVTIETDRCSLADRLAA